MVMGELARLMSYAMLRKTLDTGGVWSIATGLARNKDKYMQHLSNCDRPRRNDLDGCAPFEIAFLASFASRLLPGCFLNLGRFLL